MAHLECSPCHTQFPTETGQTVCPQCGGVHLVRYDLASLRLSARRDDIQARAAAANTSLGMWRYAGVLPDVEPVTLGEGFTPMLAQPPLPQPVSQRGGGRSHRHLQGTWAFPGSVHRTPLWTEKLAVPSAGNAAGALAAYAAAAGIAAYIFMPRDVPLANYLEAVAYGSNVTLVDGLISDCARLVAERRDAEGWFDISSLKEPFRVEGKKTMGYELVEQSGWQYPDAVFYPTGGGVGLIGMWKAFEEMETLGWVTGKRRPKMIAVQASGCAPVAKAFREGENASKIWLNAATFASGLRVPKPYGDELILDIVRQSGGLVLDFDDRQILASLLDWARHEGLFLSPEGAAATAAYDHLIETGWLSPEDRVVIFNTGAGLKYADVTAAAMRLALPQPAKASQEELEKDHRGVILPARHRAGGIITPQ